MSSEKWIRPSFVVGQSPSPVDTWAPNGTVTWRFYEPPNDVPPTIGDFVYHLDMQPPSWLAGVVGGFATLDIVVDANYSGADQEGTPTWSFDVSKLLKNAFVAASQIDVHTSATGVVSRMAARLIGIVLADSWKIPSLRVGIKFAWISTHPPGGDLYFDGIMAVGFTGDKLLVRAIKPKEAQDQPGLFVAASDDESAEDASLLRDFELV